MTEQRLREIARGAELPFPKFLLAAKDVLGVPMQKFQQLVPAIVDKCNELGDDEAENVIAKVL